MAKMQKSSSSTRCCRRDQDHHFSKPWKKTAVSDFLSLLVNMCWFDWMSDNNVSHPAVAHFHTVSIQFIRSTMFPNVIKSDRYSITLYQFLIFGISIIPETTNAAEKQQPKIGRWYFIQFQKYDLFRVLYTCEDLCFC